MIFIISVWIWNRTVSRAEKMNMFFSLGRHLCVPADGFLLLFGNGASLGLFLPNNRHRVGVWRGEVLRLRGADDRHQTQHVLVSLLEILRPPRDVRGVHLLLHLLQPRHLWSRLRVPRLGRDPGAADVLLLDDLGPGLRHLLRPHAARHNHRGNGGIHVIECYVTHQNFFCDIISSYSTWYKNYCVLFAYTIHYYL